MSSRRSPPRPPGFILWTGPRHSGKTPALRQLIGRVRAAGLRVAGLLAPSVYRRGVLVGFDAVDLSTGERWRLLRRCRPSSGKGPSGAARVGRFAFVSGALGRGRRALSRRHARGADLIVVDEFGPLELAGRGWRRAVETLRRGGVRDLRPQGAGHPPRPARRPRGRQKRCAGNRTCTPYALILLVVREGIIARVRRLYRSSACAAIRAGEPRGGAEVLTLLRWRRRTRPPGRS